MAKLQNCGKCKKLISSELQRCPHCGFIHYYCLACEELIEYKNLRVEGIRYHGSRPVNWLGGHYNYRNNDNRIVEAMRELQGVDDWKGYFVKKFSHSAHWNDNDVPQHFPKPAQDYVKKYLTYRDYVSREFDYYTTFHDACYKIIKSVAQVKYSGGRCELCNTEHVSYRNDESLKRDYMLEVDDEFSIPKYPIKIKSEDYINLCCCERCGHPKSISLKRSEDQLRTYDCTFCNYPVNPAEQVIIYYESVNASGRYQKRFVAHKICYTLERKMLVDRIHAVWREIDKEKLEEDRSFQERLTLQRQNDQERQRQQKRNQDLEEARKVIIYVALIAFVILVILSVAS